MREEGKATLLTLRFLTKLWVLTFSLALSLMLFWPCFGGKIGGKQFALPESAHWRLAQSKCEPQREPQRELGGVGHMVTWEQERCDCGNSNSSCLTLKGSWEWKSGILPFILWCNSCWYADLPSWQGEVATVNNWQVTTGCILAVTQKLTKACSVAFVLENVAVCNLTCKCVHS